ncbi:MAG TPA: helix-turn-helix transcriptional regulator [Candidatus Limnocylindrales bacterium]|nr:helix-turn-helix transcriptional regulator [Candidatus Limnocylindrales bacterium]
MREFSSQFPVELRQIVGGQLEAARRLRALSLRVAAVQLGISHSYLAQIEKGQRTLPIEILFKASRLYKVSVDVLLGREDLPGSNQPKALLASFAKFFRAASA